MYKVLSLGLFAMLFAGFSIAPAMAYEVDKDFEQRLQDLESDFEQKRQSIQQYYDQKYQQQEIEYGKIKLEIVQKIEQNQFSDSEIDAMYNELFAFYDEARSEIDFAMLLELEELEKAYAAEIDKIDAEHDSTYTDYNADGTTVTDYDDYEKYDDYYDEYDRYEDDNYRDYEEHNEREYFESDPEWPEIQPLAQRIMDAIPMDKIQRLWESGNHDALVELIVTETDLTLEQTKQVLAFFERVETEEYDEYEENDYYDRDYPDYDYTENQPYYDDSKILRLEQRIVDLEEENNILRNTIAELEEKLEKVNAVVLEQIKLIYEWVLGQ